MKERFYLSENWKFTTVYEDRMLFPEYDDSAFETVRIPHTVKETPFNYFDESEYQMLTLYRKHIDVPADWEGKCIKLTFDGAAHYADVYVNGDRAARHYCGYTAFTVDISSLLKYGCENLISVKLDSREDLDQPPFGHVIDYMTYGGLYRNVYLDVYDNAHMERLFIYSEINDTSVKLITTAYVEGKTQEGTVVKEYIKKHGSDDAEREIASWELPAESSAISVECDPGEVEKWYPEAPVLYDVRVSLTDKGGKILDEQIVTTGIRSAV